MLYSRNFSKTVYLKFIGSLTRQGKKKCSKKILDTSFQIVSRKLNLSLDLILVKLFLKLQCFLEIKKRKLGKNFHLVPFPIKRRRQNFLKIKWLLQSVNEDIRKIPLWKKLSLEIINILLDKPSKTREKKNAVLQDALKNRSNIHFRW